MRYYPTNLLTHFTKKSESASAKQNLESILSSRIIRATPNGWFKHKDPANSRCVCLTDVSLVDINKLVRRFSDYGLVFAKSWIIDKRRGNPIFYMTGDMVRIQLNNAIDQIGNYAGWSDAIKPFVDDYNRAGWAKRTVLHEQEWRVPQDLKFEYRNIRMGIVPQSQVMHFKKKYPNIKTWISADLLNQI